MGWLSSFRAIRARADAASDAVRPRSFFASLRGGADGVEADYVAILEVDRFAALRRDIGFRIANAVLAHLAARVASALDGCEIGRIGRTTLEGAFRAGTRDEARRALERLGRSLSERISVDGVVFDLQVLIGAAAAGGVGDREEALDHAAAALDRHRPVSFSDEVGAGGPDEVALIRDLRRAIEEGGLDLHYQPKFRSRTGSIDSAEALLRWPRAEGAEVSIERLIRLAESTGAIRDLTEWVIDRAVADQARLAAVGHDLTVYVNISGVLLPDAAFTRALLIKLASARGRIGLEITETAVIQDPEAALANLRALAEAGIRIAIDDYGSGLSSLSYLKQLPASELKIDQMFISGLVDSHRDPLLVRSSIDLAHALDMEVTAEGVDDALALQLLRVMGCDLVQGYLISPPLPLARFEAFLAGFDADSQLEPPKVVIPGAA